MDLMQDSWLHNAYEDVENRSENIKAPVPKKKFSNTNFAQRMRSRKQEEKSKIQEPNDPKEEVTKFKSLSVDVTRLCSQDISKAPRSIELKRKRKRSLAWSRGIVSSKRKKKVKDVDRSLTNGDINESKDEEKPYWESAYEDEFCLCSRTMPFVGKIITKESRQMFLEQFIKGNLLSDQNEKFKVDANCDKINDAESNLVEPKNTKSSITSEKIEEEQKPEVLEIKLDCSTDKGNVSEEEKETSAKSPLMPHIRNLFTKCSHDVQKKCFRTKRSKSNGATSAKNLARRRSFVSDLSDTECDSCRRILPFEGRDKPHCSRTLPFCRPFFMEYLDANYVVYTYAQELGGELVKSSNALDDKSKESDGDEDTVSSTFNVVVYELFRNISISRQILFLACF